jgi:hypothetical protein
MYSEAQMSRNAMPGISRNLKHRQSTMYELSAARRADDPKKNRQILRSSFLCSSFSEGVTS